ncbi:MAG: hypothetical protein Q8M76_13745 [Spirochaetaceae bacterium]|nr:hypothetical protein [Spirochaetaceae bacterium]
MISQGSAPTITFARLAAIAAALALAAIVYSCSSGPGRALGSAEVIGSWQESGAVAAIVYRISCDGALAIERWGITVRADSESRRYWESLVMDERLPPGSSSTGVLRIGFAEQEERLVEKSAAVETAWFE